MAGSPLFVEAMVAAWIHPFHDPVMIKGDHCMLGIDFDKDILFGNSMSPLASPQLRGVNSRHPQKVTKFCKRVITRCNQHQLAEQLAALQQLDKMELHHFDELEEINSLLTKILTMADRCCAPQNPAPWSPSLNQAYLRHCLWSITLTVKKTKHNLMPMLTAIQQRLLLTPDDAEASKWSISANLHRAQKALCTAKQEAAALQKKHLEAVLNEAQAANQRKKLKALTHLIRAETNRRCYAAF